MFCTTCMYTFHLCFCVIVGKVIRKEESNNRINQGKHKTSEPTIHVGDGQERIWGRSQFKTEKFGRCSVFHKHYKTSGKGDLGNILTETRLLKGISSFWDLNFIVSIRYLRMEFNLVYNNRVNYFVKRNYTAKISKTSCDADILEWHGIYDAVSDAYHQYLWISAG